MRAGFIPTRPERKESIMAVPASKHDRVMLPTGCMSPTGRSENGRLWHVGGFVVAHFKIKNLCLPRWLIWSGSGRTGMVGAYTESAYACGRNGFGRRGRGGGIAGPCQFAVSPFPDALRQVRERSRRLSAGGRARPRSRGGIGITGHRAALPLSPGMTMPGLSSLRIRAGTLCH